jgi:hypothetical protein
MVFFQPSHSSFKIPVYIENDTVRLSQAHMVELFQTTKQNISLHINNIYKEGELQKISTIKDYLTVQNEGERKVERKVLHYNLDVIISVGYRVRSPIGTIFRIRAMQIIKDYMFKGIAIHKRVEHLEQHAILTDKQLANTKEQLDFFIQKALPPTQ